MFAQLNAACVGEVVVVHVATGVRCAAPVHVLSLCSSSSGECVSIYRVALWNIPLAPEV